MSPRLARCSTGSCITATCSNAGLEVGAPRPHLHRKEEGLFDARALPSRSRDLSLSARMAAEPGGLRRPPFRTWIGALVASPRCRVFRPGLASIRLFRPDCEKCLPNDHRRVINTLVLVQFR